MGPCASSPTGGREAFEQAAALLRSGAVDEALARYHAIRDALAGVASERNATAAADDHGAASWAICHNQMGTCHQKLGAEAEAVACFTVAVDSAAPKHLHLFMLNRGRVLQAAGDLGGARADFENVVALRSGSPDARKARDVRKAHSHLAQIEALVAAWPSYLAMLLPRPAAESEPRRPPPLLAAAQQRLALAVALLLLPASHPAPPAESAEDTWLLPPELTHGGCPLAQAPLDGAICAAVAALVTAVS